MRPLVNSETAASVLVISQTAAEVPVISQTATAVPVISQTSAAARACLGLTGPPARAPIMGGLAGKVHSLTAAVQMT